MGMLTHASCEVRQVAGLEQECLFSLPHLLSPLFSPLPAGRGVGVGEQVGSRRGAGGKGRPRATRTGSAHVDDFTRVQRRAETGLQRTHVSDYFLTPLTALNGSENHRMRDDEKSGEQSPDSS